MSVNWDLITTVLSSGIGGVLLTKIVEAYFIPKKDEKQFDEKVRNELWDRIKNLEGRIDEQNRMLLEIMKENAELKTKVHLLNAENSFLKETD